MNETQATPPAPETPTDGTANPPATEAVAAPKTAPSECDCYTPHNRFRDAIVPRVNDR